MQSQIYLNFAEAMPIDGGAPVTTAVAKSVFYCSTKDYQPTTAVATNRASRIQSQIYLNFAEAMPIDGRAQVATLQPHITAAYNFHDFPYFPAFPHFPKNSPFPPFPVKPINQETIPTPR